MNAKIKALVGAVASFLKSTGEKIQNTHPFLQILSFLACAAIVCVLVLSILFVPRTQRSVFFFPDAKDSSPVLEVRYLPRAKTNEARVRRYVSELLLGPITPGVSPVFPKKTAIVDCLVRDDAAYINLSPEVLEGGSGMSDYRATTELFKKNVCTNFRSIDRIYLYFDGIEVYSEQPYVDAAVKK